MSALPVTALKNQWTSNKSMNSATKITLLGNIRKALVTANPNDKRDLNKLLGEIAGSIQTPKSRPIYTLHADIKDLLDESQTNALRIRDQELQIAVDQQTRAIKDVSSQIVNISRTLNPSQGSAFEDQKLTPELVKKVKDMLVGDLKTTFTDIIGNEDGKNILKRVLVLPMTQPKFTENISTGKGILLFGPPGTGKTLLAKAAASELAKRIANSRFIEVQPSKILGSYVGDTEKNITAIFTVARKYKGTGKSGSDLQEATPDELKDYFTIVFFDEVDGIAPSKSSAGVQDYTVRQVNQLLVEMGGLDQSGGKVYFIAATNYPSRVESAILRRIGTRVYVPLPLPDERWQVLEYYLGGREREELKTETDAGKIKALTDLQTFKVSFFNQIKLKKNEIKKMTAWFSNSDIDSLAQAILASSVDWGVSHWWYKDNITGEWKMSKHLLSTEPKDPKDTTIVYKNVIEFNPAKDPTEALPPQETKLMYIEPVLDRAKRSVTKLDEVYQMEWYALNGDLLKVPSKSKATENVSEDGPLFTALVYHMYQFESGVDDEYGKELALVIWRLILNEPSFGDDQKKWAVINSLWTKDPTSWPHTYTSVRNSLKKDLDAEVLKILGSSMEFPKKLKNLVAEFKK